MWNQDGFFNNALVGFAAGFFPLEKCLALIFHSCSIHLSTSKLSNFSVVTFCSKYTPAEFLYPRRRTDGRKSRSPAMSFQCGSSRKNAIHSGELPCSLTFMFSLLLLFFLLQLKSSFRSKLPPEAVSKPVLSAESYPAYICILWAYQNFLWYLFHYTIGGLCLYTQERRHFFTEISAAVHLYDVEHTVKKQKILRKGSHKIPIAAAAKRFFRCQGEFSAETSDIFKPYHMFRAFRIGVVEIRTLWAFIKKYLCSVPDCKIYRCKIAKCNSRGDSPFVWELPVVAIVRDTEEYLAGRYFRQSIIKDSSDAWQGRYSHWRTVCIITFKI